MLPDRLTMEDFFQKLTMLYQDCRKKNSVNVTYKRYDGRTKPIPRNQKKQAVKKAMKKPEHPAEVQMLCRATNGKKKLSLIIMRSEMNRFLRALNSCMKTNLDGLKKVKKNAKTKTAAAATK